MTYTISFKYRSHRGTVEDRTIDVDTVGWLASPGYDYQPGWFISGMCHDRKARRSFALSHIVLDNPTRMPLLRLGYFDTAPLVVDQAMREAHFEECANIAEAIDSGRGNEAEIAKAIRLAALKQEGSK